jgi:hypothetical protein
MVKRRSVVGCAGLMYYEFVILLQQNQRYFFNDALTKNENVFMSLMMNIHIDSRKLLHG